MMEYSRLIETVPLFKEKLSRPQRDSLCDAMEEMYFIKGEHVLTQNDVGDTFCLLFEGTCEVDVDGRIVTPLVSSGEFFGERALLEDEPRSATVRVTSDCATVLA